MLNIFPKLLEGLKENRFITKYKCNILKRVENSRAKWFDLKQVTDEFNIASQTLASMCTVNKLKPTVVKI